MNKARHNRKQMINRMIEEAMNSKQYKEARQKDLEQATIKALVRFTLIGCIYLDMVFRCKKKGLLKFLEFVKKTVCEIGDDNDFIRATNDYYKDKMQLDVMAFLGMQFVGEEDGESV